MSFEDDLNEEITLPMEEYGNLVEALRKEKALVVFLDMQLNRAAEEIKRLRILAERKGPAFRKHTVSYTEHD